jgi:hypothetical protein
MPDVACLLRHYGWHIPWQGIGNVGSVNQEQERCMNDRLRQIIVLVFAIAQATIGLVSNDWFQPNVGEVSDGFENPFTPAGITFAVWGYLYVAVIAYGIYQVLPSQRERALHRRTGGWVALGCAASTLWPPVFSMVGLFGTPEFRLGPLWSSVLLIVILTVSLMVVVQQIRRLHETMTNRDHWLVALPLFSYLAWASVATIANVTTLLIALGWNPGTSGALWSTVMIIVATLIVIGVIFTSRSRVGIVGFAAVILWAFIGIYLGNNDESTLVGTTALVAAAIVALFCVWRLVALPPSHTDSASVRV